MKAEELDNYSFRLATGTRIVCFKNKLWKGATNMSSALWVLKRRSVQYYQHDSQSTILKNPLYSGTLAGRIFSSAN